MTTISTLQHLAKLWNQMAVVENKTYCNYTEQLMQYYKLRRKNKTKKEGIKATTGKIVLVVFKHASRGLEYENLSQTKPLTICPKKVTNCPNQNAIIDVDLNDILPSKDSQPIVLAVPPAPTLPLSPSSAVVNRQNIAEPAQPMIPYPNQIPRPTCPYPHPIPNTPWPPMPHYSRF